MRLPAGARIAAVASGGMIAQQVAGKAVRDALFLSRFNVKNIPIVMAAAAVLSLLAALWLSRIMVRYTPAKVVPLMFALSGGGLLAEWGVSFVAPRMTAVALYLHTALFGTVVISAFWSLINESFDPHSGRRAVRWITGGGTAGGVLGGLLAWRAADHISLPAMLPVLAGINAVCTWSTWHLQRSPGRPDTAVVPVVAPDGPPVMATGSEVPDTVNGPLFRLLWGTPYLRNLALVVALGAVTSGLLDYVFSVVAVAHYANGPQLLAFFAKFWLAVGILSFLLQTLFGRIVLEKLGLAFTVAILPTIVLLGGALGIAVPGLLSMVVLRGGEASQRNSLFRAAYELLYTPLSAQKKRAAKIFIDVGCDRAGTVAAGGVVMATVALCDTRMAGLILLVIAMCCAIVSVARSVPLDRGYVTLLEDSLRKSAKQMAPRPTEAELVQELSLRDTIVEQLEPAFEARAIGGPIESIDAEMQAVLDLRSGETERVGRVLHSKEPLAAPLVAFTVLLLADRELRVDAMNALVRAAPTAMGQLVDALCDPRVSVHARRRIPRVLTHCPTVAAAEGLLRGIEDQWFGIRYACGRALLEIRVTNPHIVIALDRVVAIIKREVVRDQKTWDLDGEHDDVDPLASLIDRLRHDRFDRNVEHLFNVLALYLDPDSLRTALKALHEDNDALRGTALEYLETVLPDEVRELVWPFLGEASPMRAARPLEDILADLRARPV